MSESVRSVPISIASASTSASGTNAGAQLAVVGLAHYGIVDCSYGSSVPSALVSARLSVVPLEAGVFGLDVASLNRLDFHFNVRPPSGRRRRPPPPPPLVVIVRETRRQADDGRSTGPITLPSPVLTPTAGIPASPMTLPRRHSSSSSSSSSRPLPTDRQGQGQTLHRRIRASSSPRCAISLLRPGSTRKNGPKKVTGSA